jgi:pyrroline-5-carboxylate reductase
MSATARTSIGFIGGGNMGRALIAALRRTGTNPATIFVAEPEETLRIELERDFQINVAAQASSFIAEVDIVVLAVKPQDLPQVLAPLRATIAATRPLVISIAAGLSTAQLRKLCGDSVPIVRAMPNRPALVGAGATGLYACADVDAADRHCAESVLATAGMVVWVTDEALMDVVTAVSGSGPAYFFRLAEALAAAGVAHGLDIDSARRLAAATLHGAGQMAVEPVDLAALRLAVTSKGGTTAAALATFDALRFDASVAAAVQAAIERGQELAAELGKKGD